MAEGAVRVERINLAEMMRALTHEKPRQGVLSGEYNFRLEPADISSLRATGHVILDDVEPAGAKASTLGAIVAEVLRKLNIAGLLGKSDTAVSFEMKGTVLTAKRAYVSGAVMAVEIEPGGTVDLRTRQVDLYVIGVPIRQVRSLLVRVPVARLVESLKDKFTRVHLKGRWDDPPRKLVQIAPIRHVTKGTVDFLKTVVQEGTDIGGGLLKLLKGGGERTKKIR